MGGSSELEVNEKKDRVNDALNATKAAVEEGIVPGGGVALLRCIDILDDVKVTSNDHKLGIDIIRSALKSPAYTIALNAGVNAQSVLDKLMSSKGNQGYNALTGEFVDMIKSGQLVLRIDGIITFTIIIRKQHFLINTVLNFYLRVFVNLAPPLRQISPSIETISISRQLILLSNKAQLPEFILSDHYEIPLWLFDLV